MIYGTRQDSIRLLNPAKAVNRRTSITGALHFMVYSVKDMATQVEFLTHRCLSEMYRALLRRHLNSISKYTEQADTVQSHHRSLRNLESAFA
jgi:hypothetical protein